MNEFFVVVSIVPNGHDSPLRKKRKPAIMTRRLFLVFKSLRSPVFTVT